MGINTLKSRTACQRTAVSFLLVTGPRNGAKGERETRSAWTHVFDTLGWLAWVKVNRQTSRPQRRRTTDYITILAREWRPCAEDQHIGSKRSMLGPQRRTTGPWNDGTSDGGLSREPMRIHEGHMRIHTWRMTPITVALQVNWPRQGKVR
ncbi:hypothetical protein BGZ61DRAFT_193392 [Ilyonectria robusta]|uniref:uncharacterized protein n=1 Tax=Ilyonectria robusta TaxID=1079257 RepID=UPI001E8CDE80|nr:uncharacterized protein BGZ61DRAFT_193392 [Ilyonectria robusta]KAH8654813.1 hypothetical protein BGZ61DRAFT_193392 [Ilyonectria robusta]